MQNILFQVKNQQEVPMLMEIIKKFGCQPIIISDEERKIRAKQEMVKIIDRNPKTSISGSEITKALKEVRKKRHAKKKQN